jgi:hypothetical protein
MNTFAPLTASSDPNRSMPAQLGARLDAASRAVASLRDEQRRLQRLGFELPLARCHQQLRYWQFVQNVCRVAAEVKA